MALFDTIRAGASGAADSAYEIDRSVRFNPSDSPYFSRTPSSAGNRDTWTLSCWVKKGKVELYQAILYAGPSTGSNHNNTDAFAFTASDQLFFGGEVSQSVTYNIVTNRKFRDVSAWYHIVLAVDTTQGTASDRVKLYINGVQETSFGTETYMSQNQDTFVNATNIHAIGYTSSGRTIEGYFAEYYLINGQQLTPSSFGETDATTGQWNPKNSADVIAAETFGTNGFYMNFSDNSGTTATTLGKDSSGNGNNWTPNNFSVASGIEGDSFSDTPTNNFSTLNPLIASGVGTSNTITAPTLIQGNLRRGGRTKVLTSTIPLINNKYYAEYKMHDTMYGGYHQPGVYKSDASQTTSTDSAKSAYYDIGMIMIEGTQQSGGIGSYGFNSYTNADIVQIAIDTTQNPAKIWFGKNNSWENSGDPANGTNGFTLTADAEYVFYAGYGSNHVNGIEGTMFFGAHTGGFNYDPPTGFVTASSANLPDPTIKLPNKHFDTLTWSGNSTEDTDIAGLNFSPDWVWIKSRSHSVYAGSLKYNHVVWDTLRGVGLDTSASSSRKELTVNETYAEGNATNLSNYYGHVSAFNSDGFELDHITGQPPLLTNMTGRTYVGWNWDAGETDGKTYTVTVVDDSGNKYRFDGFGTSAVTLDLAEGGTYIFNYPSAHPFKFSTTADGTHGGGSEYTTGVTHNSSTQVTIVVAASAPQLYYYCGSHSGMGGAVNTNSTLGSSNFDGTGQATVKTNASAGFSIVLYTGNATGSSSSAVWQTIGHGLGVTPQLIIMKARSYSSADTHWTVYHHKVTDANTDYLVLDTNEARVQTDINYMGSTLPTSSVFSLGYNFTTNKGSETYIAYCFSEVAGYSKFGLYKSNSDDDGTFIYLGFKPAWFLVKNMGDTADWVLWDNKRNTFNPRGSVLQPANSDADYSTGVDIDFVSNGVKLRGGSGYFNNPADEEYIYFAFAESPFKNARAS